MSQFSSNDSVSLEKRIELSSEIKKTEKNNINQVYEIDKCAKWILDNDYKTVCLQFPDYLLCDSTEIVYQLEDIINQKVYVLGDTSYGSCCIDYISARHVSADAIIHFGPTCFSKTEEFLPCLKIFEKFYINVKDFCDAIRKCKENNISVILNTPYVHKLENIKNELDNLDVKFCTIDDDFSDLETTVIYVGKNDRKLLNLYLNLGSKEIYYFDPEDKPKCLKVYEVDTKILKRRYYLMEKIKDSRAIGIVISTLAVKNYLKIIERVKTLVKIHGKNYYVISVGKPTEAKLANFPEVDVFVIVGCAMNEIYENRNYLRPIATPYDVEASLNPKLQNGSFSYDYNTFLTEANQIDEKSIKELQKSDVSLLTGNIRYHETTDESEQNKEENKDAKEIVLRDKSDMQLANTSCGAGYLASRSWKGLEQKLGENEPQLAVKGREGIAQGYENEK